MRKLVLPALVGVLVVAGLVARVGAASPPTVSVGDLAVVEGDAGTPRSVKVPVSLSDPQAGNVTVTYTTSAGSATAGSDYTAKASGTVSIPAGKLLKAVSVKILPDTVGESDETLTVNLTAASGGVVIGRATGTVTILDDDPTGGLEVSVGDVDVVEGDSGAPRSVKVPVGLSAPQATDVTIGYTTSAGSATAGSDYTAKASGTVKVPAGKLLKAVSVKILPDTSAESDETLTVTLTTTSAGTITRTTGTVTILDDDTAPPAANLWTWGNNGNGQLGDGTTADSNLPVPIPPDTWTQVDAGLYHTCGVRSDGTAWCWGYNFTGQLGNGTNTDSNTPVQVGTATTWNQLAAGEMHSCGVRSDGTAWCWGYNGDGQLGDGTNTDSTTPVQVGTATTWTQITAGYLHTCGVRSDGTAWCWGDNFNGQLGDGTNTDTNEPVQVGTATTWTQITAGYYHSCGVRSDGTAWCWGYNGTGQLGDGTTTDSNTPVQVSSSEFLTQISAGGAHSAAVSVLLLE